MFVRDYIDLMGALSVGSDNQDETERSLFLYFLNQAHLELFRDIGYLDPIYLNSESLVSNQGESFVTLSYRPHMIKSVYNVDLSKKLIQCNLSDIVNLDPLMNETNSISNVYGYYSSLDKVFFYPPFLQSATFKIWYVKEPDLLEEDMEDIQLTYSKVDLDTLVQGGLYLLYSNEGSSFNDPIKASVALRRWTDGKNKYSSSIWNSEGSFYSTYTNL